jgi:hypothetical protein
MNTTLSFSIVYPLTTSGVELGVSTRMPFVALYTNSESGAWHCHWDVTRCHTEPRWRKGEQHWENNLAEERRNLSKGT